MSYTLNIEPSIVKEAETRAARKGTTIDAMIRACLLVFVAHDAADDGELTPVSQNQSPKGSVIKIGAMKDEISLPDSFDETFDSLDQDMASMFNGYAL